MTAKFDPDDSFNSKSDPSQSETDLLDEQFELLSAYLDGEVTPQEKEQVQKWLEQNSEFQALYHRLRQLQQGLSSFPIPVSTQSPQDISEGVFARVEKQWVHKVAFWGGAVVAAGAVAVLSFIGGDSRSPLPQMVESPSSEDSPLTVTTEGTEPPLMIAVNRSVVPIPKAPVAPSSEP